MKVSGHTPPDLLASKTPSANTPKAQADAAQTATSAASNPGVAVMLTGGTRAMGKELAGQSSVVDVKKVAAMKAAIADGSFTVNPQAIADKLLANARDMLPATPKPA
jgi:negative regulator of flagellin synthesis FlgM